MQNSMALKRDEDVRDELILGVRESMEGGASWMDQLIREWRRLGILPRAEVRGGGFHCLGSAPVAAPRAIRDIPEIRLLNTLHH
jgi:hypothetical protein